MARLVLLLSLACCALQASASLSPPPGPPLPPYNTPPGEGPVTLSSDQFGTSSDRLNQGFSFFDFAKFGLSAATFDAQFRTCDVCYTQYSNKPVSSATVIPATSWCSAYTNAACCNADTVADIDSGKYNGGLYPGYAPRCGALSPACFSWFQREACFYECDRNMGRFRQFRDNGCVDSSGKHNAWSVINIPLAAAQCSQMYSDCANDLFCSTPHRSYFDYPNVTVNPLTCASTSDPQCVRGSVLYSSPADMCAAIFSGAANTTLGYVPAFVSTTGPAAAAYRFPNKGDAPFTTANPNPNDVVDTSLGNASSLWPTTPEYPQLCPWRPAFDAATQCVNDMYYYFGMLNAIMLYSSTSVLFNAPPPGTFAPPSPPPSASSAGVYSAYTTTNTPASSSAASVSVVTLLLVALAAALMA